MEQARLIELSECGWRLTRDGSTSTAFLAWDDPDDPDSGWELMVLHTAGHPAKFTLTPNELGLSERPLADAERLHRALEDVMELLRNWQGELPEED
jgi:hypothetical protein